MLNPRTAVAALGVALSLSLAVPAAADAADPPAGGTLPTMALGISNHSEQLVMFDPTTGLARSSASAQGGAIVDADYSSVRGEMFYVVIKDGLSLIRRAPVVGSGSGPAGFVASGSHVTVSPDGGFLAYVYDPDGWDGSEMEAIAVRDLDTGVERHFAGPPVPEGSHPLDHLTINDLAISPDSTQLAFDYWGGGEVLLVDLVSDTSLADARSLGVAGAVRSPAWRSDGSLSVIGERGEVQTVDLDTGAVSYLVLGDRAEALDADDAGRLMIELTAYSGDPANPVKSFAMVDAYRQVTHLNQPFYAVVW